MRISPRTLPNTFVQSVRPLSCRAALLVLGILCAVVMPIVESLAQGEKVLVFSKTAGFRHASIPSAVAAIQQLGTSSGFSVTATEDAAGFTEENLRQFACVVFCLTSGDVLGPAEEAAFERYIRAGGGYVGIHSASDTEPEWEWYGRLVGAYFHTHPEIQTATVVLNNLVHPSTAGLPKRWVRTDEWYSFRAHPRGRVHVLATVDERTFAPVDRMGFDHPISWCQQFEGGRAWYTGMGHTAESYSEPEFLRHILGGIRWASGAMPVQGTAPVDAHFEKVTLVNAPRDPMQMEVTSDGRLFYIQRGGAFYVWKAGLAAPVLAAQLAIDGFREDGLLGLALDPDFAENQWVYLFYSPLGPDPIQRVSRFTMNGDTLELASERVLLTIPVQRETCCHSGGAMDFGPGGELFIAVGDNTNPFESSGYTPIDEQPGRSAWDAQRSSANANDLRGKILRVKPQPDGTYTIPDGNLFPPGTPNTRPEIYTMGNRNPFRFSVDSKTGWLYWGEVGPDAQLDDPSRGPRGYDEINQARAAGNYGWPYFMGNNQAYHRFDFATRLSGPAFDAQNPSNESPNNTGPINLPPAQSAWIWYPYTDSAEFPEFNGGAGRTAMAGPVYHFDAGGSNPRRLPAYYDRTLFAYEWSRNALREIKLDDEGNVLKINPFLPSMAFIRPIEMKLGPDGALYVIEWGTGFYGANADAKIVRLDYVGPSSPPGLILQSTTALGQSFLPEPGVRVDAVARTILIALPRTSRYYRLAGPAPLRIIGVQVTGNSLVLSYE